MNTKLIIGAVVGGLLLFIWQFLSWTMLNLHGSNAKYTDKNAEILQLLSTSLPEDGTYMLPGLPPNATKEDHEKMQTEIMGKPWGSVTYHKAYNASMGMNMGRGLLVNIIAVSLLIWLLMKFPNRTFNSVFVASLAVGIFAYLTNTYPNSIWFQSNTLPDLIDSVVQWSLVGGWLGYWLNRP